MPRSDAIIFSRKLELPLTKLHARALGSPTFGGTVNHIANDAKLWPVILQETSLCEVNRVNMRQQLSEKCQLCFAVGLNNPVSGLSLIQGPTARRRSA